MNAHKPAPEKMQSDDTLDMMFGFDWFDNTKEKLSSSDVLTGLLDHGLFAEKVPPCFSTAGFSTIVSETMVDLIRRKAIRSSRRKSISALTTTFDMKHCATLIFPDTWGFRTQKRMQSKHSQFQSIGRKLRRIATSPSPQSVASMFDMSGMVASSR